MRSRRSSFTTSISLFSCSGRSESHAIRSASIRNTVSSRSEAMSSSYEVMSRSVNAFESPPFDSRMRSYSLGGTFFDPLNIMCSKKWEIPVIPGRSLREPTRYHCRNVHAGTL